MKCIKHSDWFLEWSKHDLILSTIAVPQVISDQMQVLILWIKHGDDIWKRFAFSLRVVQRQSLAWFINRKNRGLQI